MKTLKALRKSRRLGISGFVVNADDFPNKVIDLNAIRGPFCRYWFVAYEEFLYCKYNGYMGSPESELCKTRAYALESLYGRPYGRLALVSRYAQYPPLVSNS